MTADRFHPIDDTDPDGPSRLRRVVTGLFVLLFTIFVYEALDGVERAAEQAERRENALRAACLDPMWDMTGVTFAVDEEDNGYFAPDPQPAVATTQARSDAEPVSPHRPPRRTSRRPVRASGPAPVLLRARAVPGGYNFGVPPMTPDHPQHVEEKSRTRTLALVVMLMLVTVLLYQVIDDVQRRAYQRRREMRRSQWREWRERQFQQAVAETATTRPDDPRATEPVPAGPPRPPPAGATTKPEGDRPMTPDQDTTGENGRIRGLATALFLCLVTVFLFEVLSGVQRREVERRRDMRIHVRHHDRTADADDQATSPTPDPSADPSVDRTQ